MVLTAEEIIHLYALLEGIFHKFSYYEYPLVHNVEGNAEGSSHFLNDQLKFVEGKIEQHEIDALSNGTSIDFKYITVRAFDHEDGNMRILVYPSEVLGTGAFGSVYGIQVIVRRDDGTVELVDLALKIQNAPLPAFSERPPLEPNLIEEQVPTTIPQLQAFGRETTTYSVESGPRRLEHHQRRVNCQPWYMEPIMLHAIQQSPDIPNHVKQMSPWLYASLLVHAHDSSAKSLLLMQRFRNVSTLSYVLDNQSNDVTLDFPTVFGQNLEYVCCIQYGIDGLLLDMHDDNVLVNVETNEIKVVDPSLANFTYDGIRFESNACDSYNLAQHVNLKVMAQTVDTSAYRWCHSLANEKYLPILMLASVYGIGTRQLVTRRAIELLSFHPSIEDSDRHSVPMPPQRDYETNFPLDINMDASSTFDPLKFSALDSQRSSNPNSASLWLLYSTLLYRVDRRFPWRWLTKLVEWCSYLRDLTIVFDSAMGNPQTLQLSLSSPMMRSVHIVSDVDLDLQVRAVNFKDVEFRMDGKGHITIMDDMAGEDGKPLPHLQPSKSPWMAIISTREPDLESDEDVDTKSRMVGKRTHSSFALEGGHASGQPPMKRPAYFKTPPHPGRITTYMPSSSSPIPMEEVEDDY